MQAEILFCGHVTLYPSEAETSPITHVDTSESELLLLAFNSHWKKWMGGVQWGYFCLTRRKALHYSSTHFTEAYTLANALSSNRSLSQLSSDPASKGALKRNLANSMKVSVLYSDIRAIQI